MGNDGTGSSGTIQLPIQPKDVFRILALRSVVENDEMLKALNEHFNEIFKGIEQTERLKRKGKNPFDYQHPHKGLTINKEKLTDFTERELCASKKAFFDNSFDGIGTVIDYELPLDETRYSAFGKVDLVSLSEDTHILYLLEVKKHDSNEHPLRAMFEIFTFWKMLQDGGKDKAGDFSIFIEKYTSAEQNKSKFGERKPSRVVPGLLLCDGSPILNRLTSLKTKDKKGVSVEEKRLYKRFFKEGLRVFRFTENREQIEIIEQVSTNLDSTPC